MRYDPTAVPPGRVSGALAVPLLTVPDVTDPRPATVNVKVPPLTGPPAFVTEPVSVTGRSLALKRALALGAATVVEARVCSVRSGGWKTGITWPPGNVRPFSVAKSPVRERNVRTTKSLPWPGVKPLT